MSNNSNNRINPLVITNLLLAVIARSMLWTHVGPTVEPQAQAAQEAEEMKTEREWFLHFHDGQSRPNYELNPLVILPMHEDRADIYDNEIPVTLRQFRAMSNTMFANRLKNMIEKNQTPQWAIFNYRTHLMTDLLLKIEENTATIARNTSR